MTDNQQTGAAWFRSAAVVLTMAGILASPALSLAQRGSGGGGGGGSMKGETKSVDSTEKKDEAEALKPRCPEIVGNHALLEKMAASFDLTCAQEDKIEPLLHDEESVSKPLLAFDAFSADEKQAMMLKVKLAARAQIRPLLTPEQQKKSDAEAASVAAAGAEPKKGGKKGATPKKIATQDDAFKGEENLSAAIGAYTAFSVAERKQYILQVKQAAIRDGAPALSPDQVAHINADIAVLQKS